MDVVHYLLALLEEAWKGTGEASAKSNIGNLGAYIMIAFCGSFRGAEVFLVDLYGLKKYAELKPSHGGRSMW